MIAYDADAAGQKYARKAAKNLVAADCRVWLLEWPDYMGRQPDGTWPEDHGQDLTDFFVRHGKSTEDFLALVEQAVPFTGDEAPAPSGSYMAFSTPG